MDISVPASEANRSFSELLRRVQGGESVAVTRHGRPVARIIPAQDDGEDEGQRRRVRARDYLDRASRRPIVDIGPWTRDELYER